MTGSKIEQHVWVRWGGFKIAIGVQTIATQTHQFNNALVSCLGVSDAIGLRLQAGRLQNNLGRLLQIFHTRHAAGVQDQVASGWFGSVRLHGLVFGCRMSDAIADDRKNKHV